MAKISTQNVTKIFGSHPEKALSLMNKGCTREEIQQQTDCTLALRDIHLDIIENEFLVIMGLSGSGKSTLGRCFNGLIRPTAGKVLVNDIDIARLNKPALRRLRQQCFGMVFQNFALLPHYTVLRNVGFGLELMDLPQAERHRRSVEALEKVGLSGWEGAMPDQLSGGMKQRVGLARALVMNPDILLMDEPFSALDPLIRREMQDELLNLRQELNKTIIFITHDLDEAFKLGDRLVIMRDGEIVQADTPEAILMNPANKYVARFVASVDATQILTAAGVMKKSETLAVLGVDGPRSALRKMRVHGINSLFVLGRDRRFAGIVYADAAETLAKAGERSLEGIIRQDIVTVPPDAPVQQLIPLMADLPYPLAVVDEARKFHGLIVRGLLLGAIVEREGRHDGIA